MTGATHRKQNPEYWKARAEAAERARDEDRIAYVNRESILRDEAQRWKATHDKAAQDWREELDRRKAAERALASTQETLRKALANCESLERALAEIEAKPYRAEEVIARWRGEK